MAKKLTQVGIETGNTVEAFHVTQSIDAFTGTEDYDISLSGSLNVTGSVSIIGLSDTAQSNVITINSSTGQLFFTASSALSTTIDTGSFITNTQTGSFITNTQTGSFVTTSQTGSYLISASSTLNNIHFTSSDGSTFDVTVDTGSSSGGGGGLTWVTRDDSDSDAYNIPASNYGIYHVRDANVNLDNTLPASAAIGSRVVLIRDPAVPGSTKLKVKANTGQTIKFPPEGTTSTAGFVRWSGSQQYQTIELTCVVADTTWIVTNFFPYNNISGSKIEIS